MAVDSQTSATTPAAAPAQPHDAPGAATAPSTGDATPPPGAGAPTTSPAAGTIASPSAAATASPATAPSTAATAPGDPAAVPEPEPFAEERHAGFGSRGRLRRRARFLRKARELAYRDLGGLVFSLHRFGQRNDSLVLAKLGTLSRIDAELRTLEDSLGERRPVTVLREAGITACPRCAAIHSGEDRFCPSCGLSMSRRSDLPIAGAAAGGAAQPLAPSPPSPPSPPTPTPAPAPAPPPAGAASPASTAPATERHAAVAPASGAHAPPHAAPQPATQAFDAVPSAGAGSAGRSPTPPPSGPSQPAAPAGKDDDQPTEIIRPAAPGS